MRRGGRREEEKEEEEDGSGKKKQNLHVRGEEKCSNKRSRNVVTSSTT